MTCRRLSERRCGEISGDFKLGWEQGGIQVLLEKLQSGGLGAISQPG